MRSTGRGMFSKENVLMVRIEHIEDTMDRETECPNCAVLQSQLREQSNILAGERADRFASKAAGDFDDTALRLDTLSGARSNGDRRDLGTAKAVTRAGKAGRDRGAD